MSVLSPRSTSSRRPWPDSRRQLLRRPGCVRHGRISDGIARCAWRLPARPRRPPARERRTARLWVAPKLSPSPASSSAASPRRSAMLEASPSRTRPRSRTRLSPQALDDHRSSGRRRPPRSALIRSSPCRTAPGASTRFLGVPALSLPPRRVPRGLVPRPCPASMTRMGEYLFSQSPAPTTRSTA